MLGTRIGETSPNKFGRPALVYYRIIYLNFIQAAVQNTANNEIPSIIQWGVSVFVVFCPLKVSPTQIDDAEIENESKDANYRGNYHIADNQADEKWD